MTNRRPAEIVGFTLMELLVVIGLIAGLSVLLARSFMATDSSRMRDAEAVIASCLRIARADAMGGTRARVLVLADPSAVDYLAKIAVVSRDASGNWILNREPVVLPFPVKLVPESGVVAEGETWPANAVSAFSGTEALTLPGETQALYHYIEFTDSGTTTSGRKLVVALTDRNAVSLKFVAPESARAYILRPSGVFVIVRQISTL